MYSYAAFINMISIAYKNCTTGINNTHHCTKPTPKFGEPKTLTKNRKGN